MKLNLLTMDEVEPLWQAKQESFFKKGWRTAEEQLAREAERIRVEEEARASREAAEAKWAAGVWSPYLGEYISYEMAEAEPYLLKSVAEVKAKEEPSPWIKPQMIYPEPPEYAPITEAFRGTFRETLTGTPSWKEWFQSNFPSLSTLLAQYKLTAPERKPYWVRGGKPEWGIEE